MIRNNSFPYNMLYNLIISVHDLSRTFFLPGNSSGFIGRELFEGNFGIL